MTGSSGTGRAQRRRCLPCAPPGGRRWGYRRSICSSACALTRGAGACLAAQQPAGAVQRQRGISRCTDRSVDGGADWPCREPSRATLAAHRWPRRGGWGPSMARERSGSAMRRPTGGGGAAGWGSAPEGAGVSRRGRPPRGGGQRHEHGLCTHPRVCDCRSGCLSSAPRASTRN